VTGPGETAAPVPAAGPTLRLALDPQRRARAALTRIAETCDEAVGRSVATVGALRTLERIRRAGDEETALARCRRRLPLLDVERLLERAAAVGARLVCPGDAEWPSSLEVLGVAQPYALWVRGEGDLVELCRRSVAVVGSRASTGYGDHVASSIAAEVTERGWTVVSGAAYGIDGAAHRGALAAGGPTAAVVANGVDVAYPRGHDTLIARVLDTGGVVVSELPPGTPPNRKRFLDRNRLIAALTCGTLVVEAALRSGARSTAKHAVDLGRPLGAVPGPVTSTMSAGCHEEMRVHAAALVTDAADLLELVAPMGSELTGPRRAQPLPLDLLDEAGRVVLDALPKRRRDDVDLLAVRSGLSPEAVRRALGVLLAYGLAEQEGDRWRKA
jgi:DNA processing protein